MNKKTFFLLSLWGGCGFALPLMAQPLSNGDIQVNNAVISLQDSMVTVAMQIDASCLKMKSNRKMVLTPVLSAEGATQTLPAVSIMGRERYIKHQRNRRKQDVATEAVSIKYNKKGMAPISYYQTLPYEPWMDAARLSIEEEACGCSNTVLTTANEGTLATAAFPAAPAEPFRPTMLFATPQVETIKSRSESGSAFLVFPVSRVDIDPDLQGNARELDKIKATIGLVENDADVEIQTIRIKGYASPEGSYANNARLAKERTESLQKYVQQLYHFNPSLFCIDYEPEDWEGLRRFVLAGNLQEKESILNIIDSSLEPDPKEWRLKSTYPEAYRFLLAECYPLLRHSDYEINYTVRGFSVEETARVLKERPQKLSLQEIYLLAQTYEPGSTEYNEVFETAVRMFPEDEVANLNAANVAIMKNNQTDAERFLAKAGNSAEAIHARGVLAGLREEYQTAQGLLKQAAEMGAEGAEENLKQIENYLK